MRTIDKPVMLSPKLAILVRVTVIWCMSLLQRSHGLSFQSCQMVDFCSCRIETGELIDLHWAQNSEEGKPVFHYRKDKDDYAFSPCAGFSCFMSTNSSLCLLPNFTSHGTNLGNISSARFEVSGGQLTLLYTAIGAASNISSRVSLQCNRIEERLVLDSDTITSFNFTLQSRCACPGECHRPQSKTGGLSAGTVLVLLFLSVTALYFAIGFLYMKAVQGGNCTEAVPHRNFWCSLPLLIKDGYLFFISPCLGNRAEYRAYDKL